MPCLVPIPRGRRARASHFSCAVPISEEEEGTEQSFAMSSALFRRNGGHRLVICLVLYPFREDGGHRPVICLVLYPFPRERRAQASHLPCLVPISERAEGTGQPYSLRCTHFQGSGGHRPAICLVLCPFQREVEGTEQSFALSSALFRRSGGHRAVGCLVLYPFREGGGYRHLHFPAQCPFNNREYKVLLQYLIAHHEKKNQQN